MKKPIALLVTDTHLSENNIDLVTDIWQQAIDKCKELELFQIFFLGDFFHSRKGQPLKVLKAAQNILLMLEWADIKVTAITGNHDKASYESEDSYMDIFNSLHFEVVNNVKHIKMGSIRICLLPFFKEQSDIFKEQLSIARNTPSDLLFTHIAINGSTTNDNEYISDCIPSGELKNFAKVFVGHFHNRNEFENIVYIGSAYQANFGEDDNKGFTILYEDGSYEFTQTNFPKYIKKSVNIANLDEYLLDSDFLQLSENNHCKIELTGESEKLKSFNRNVLIGLGIQCDLKADEAIISLDETTTTTYDKKSLREGFIAFCEDNKVEDITYGTKKMELI
jgi:exonuclease SbcD